MAMRSQVAHAILMSEGYVTGCLIRVSSTVCPLPSRVVARDRSTDTCGRSVLLLGITFVTAPHAQRRSQGTSRALIGPPPRFQPSASNQLCGLRTTSGS